MKKGELTNDQKLFLENAFLFFKHKDRILADARMYNCKVPFESELPGLIAYGFLRPTLKTYLNWWQNCEQALVRKEDESEWLVYKISGNPSCGMNNCGIVNKDGEIGTENIIPFSPLWHSFTAANDHFYEFDEEDKVYTLSEIVEILKEDHNELDDNEVHIAFLKSALKQKNAQTSCIIENLEEQIWCLKKHLMKMQKTELGACLIEYEMEKERTTAKEKDINEKIIELRRKLKAGELDNKQYQELVTPLKDKREAVRIKMQGLSFMVPETFFPRVGITIEDIEKFLKRK